MTTCTCCLGKTTMAVCNNSTCPTYPYPPSTRTMCWSYVTCPACGGELIAYDTPCTKCDGVGTILDIGFGADKTSGKPPLTVTFTGNVTQAGVSPYSWVLEYGDGTSTNGSGSSLSQSHTYTVGGKTYTAKLTVTDALGAQAQAIFLIDLGTWWSRRSPLEQAFIVIGTLGTLILIVVKMRR